MPDASVPKSGTVADLLEYAARNTDRSHDIFERWELPDDDLNGKDDAQRLARLWYGQAYARCWC